MSSEPLWFTPASAMMKTCLSSIAIRRIEKMLLDQLRKILELLDRFQYAPRAITIAVRIDRSAAVLAERSANRGCDRVLISRAIDDGIRHKPALLPIADIHDRFPVRRRFVQSARRIADHRIHLRHKAQVTKLAERRIGPRLGVRRDILVHHPVQFAAAGVSVGFSENQTELPGRQAVERRQKRLELRRRRLGIERCGVESDQQVTLAEAQSELAFEFSPIEQLRTLDVIDSRASYVEY